MKIKKLINFYRKLITTLIKEIMKKNYNISSIFKNKFHYIIRKIWLNKNYSKTVKKIKYNIFMIKFTYKIPI